MASHSNNDDNIDSKKLQQQQEDQDLDSGFLSSNTVSDPVSAFLDESESGQVAAVEKATKTETSQPSTITEDNSKSDSGNINKKIVEELEMDSAYCDSGMISTNLTNDLSNLTLGRRPEEEATKTNQNEVYFQTNEEGDT